MTRGEVGHREVVRLISDGAQVVDVLPSADYDKGHLPDAVSLPLKELTADTAEAALDRTRALVVCCADGL